MTKLTSLKPIIGTLRSAVAWLPEGEREQDRHRDTQPWRKWYKTTRWRRLRWAVLVRDLFACQRCGRIEADTSQLVADHKIRHGGVEAAFFDETNLQTLCKPCHDGAKQREERRAGL